MPDGIAGIEEHFVSSLQPFFGIRNTFLSTNHGSISEFI
jgi:hypothetical protein